MCSFILLCSAEIKRYLRRSCMAVRLKLMPLVLDFGETLERPTGAICPNTNLVFTRDYRIFGQFSNFMDSDEDAPKKRHIVSLPLPEKLKLIVLCEERKAKQTRTDCMGDIEYVTAKQMKTLILPSDTTKNNKAICAFVQMLDDKTPIILYWM